MKLLVIGAQGQVGWELNRSLMPLGEVLALERTQCDLSSPESVQTAVRDFAPEVIVNAAAYTAVDKAESDEAVATTINGAAVGVLAREAAESGALLVHYSTDYVFDGAKLAPYVEDDMPNPINAYGRSKLAGERAVLDAKCDHIILRATWVYASRGNNFVRTMLRLARERKELRIVADQFGAPTSARTLADATAHIISQARREQAAGIFASGTYHATCAGYASWHSFAEAIVRNAVKLGLIDSTRVPAIIPIPTSGYPLPARRPVNSRLDNQRLRSRFGIVLPSWQHALNCVLGEIAAMHSSSAAKNP